MGDDVSSIGSHVLRIVVIQAAGAIGDFPTWVKKSATQLRAMRAHVGVYTETIIHGGDRHTQVSDLIRDYEFFAIGDNTTSSRFFSPTSTEEDNELGPRAAGAILVVTAKYAGGWTEIAYDTGGRALSANINLSDDSTVRMTAAYGVSGACCPNFSSFPTKNNRKQSLICMLPHKPEYVRKNAIIWW